MINYIYTVQCLVTLNMHRVAPVVMQHSDMQWNYKSYNCNSQIAITGYDNPTVNNTHGTPTMALLRISHAANNSCMQTLWL